MSMIVDIGLSKDTDGRWKLTVMTYSVDLDAPTAERNIENDKMMSEHVQYFNERPSIITGDEL